MSINGHRLGKLAFRFLAAAPFIAGGLFFLLYSPPPSYEAKLMGYCLLAMGALLMVPIALEIRSSGGLRAYFYPEPPFSTDSTTYGQAESMVKKGMYEEALAAFTAIADENPTVARPYLDMLDVAAYRMQDLQRTDEIYRRGLTHLEGRAAIAKLKKLYPGIRARAEEEKPEYARRIISIPPSDQSSDGEFDPTSPKDPTV